MIPELDYKILAYSLKSKQTILKMVENIPDDFLHPEIKPFWRLVKFCYENYKEVPTERVLKSVSKESWDVLSKVYEELIEIEIDEREFPMDLDSLKLRYNEHMLRQAGEAVYKNNFNGTGFNDIKEANKVLKDLVVDLDRIYTKNVFKEGSLGDTANSAWAEYKRIKASPEASAGIHLGFNELDRITNGMRPAELMLIGGESGTGKSALTMNMCINAWLGKNKIPTKLDETHEPFVRGHSVVYFTVEMPFDVMQRRLHAAVAKIPLYGVRDGNLSSEEEERFRAALRYIKEYPYPFYVVDIPRGATMRHIELKYLELCQMYPEHPPELFGLDYISLISPENDQGSDWLNLGRLAEQAHEFCRVYNIPGISPVQLNRGSKKGRPDQERIGRSAMLTQNANIVLTIAKRNDEHLMKEMQVHIIKMRDGEQGMFTLQKRLDIMRLFDSLGDWQPEVYGEDDE